MKKIILFISLPVLLVACTTFSDHHPLYQTYPPSAANGYRGLIATELGTPSTTDMAIRCSNFGGLDYASVRDEPTPNWKLAGYNYKSYRCRGLQPVPSAPPVITQQQPQPARVDLSEARSKCVELGFVTGTESFGKCVLQLSR
jgi:hypothetical protein